jgi:hypothetical protein
MRRSGRFLYRIPVEPICVKVEGGAPWILWYVKSLRASSPFLDLDFDHPIDAKILDLLAEAQDIEIEFETIGRHMKLLGADRWLEYRSLWRDALLCALEARNR